MTSTGCRADGNRQLDDHCAILNEANATGVARVIEAGSQRLLSAANLLEASIVIESRKGEAGGRELDLLIYRAAIEVVAVDQDDDVSRTDIEPVPLSSEPA